MRSLEERKADRRARREALGAEYAEKPIDAEVNEDAIAAAEKAIAKKAAKGQLVSTEEKAKEKAVKEAKGETPLWS